MKIQILILILFNTILFGQNSKKSYYENNQLKNLEIYQNNKIVKGYHYSVKGELLYKWDLKNQTIESYTALQKKDTLAEKFFEICPSYKIIQHAGIGPLFYIENYKNRERDGKYTEFDTLGRIIVEGNFKKWEKVGIWKYLNKDGNYENTIIISGNYDERGISIQKTILPFIIIFFTLLILGIIIIRKYSYKTYYQSIYIFTYSIFLFIMLFGNYISKQINNKTLHIIRDYFPLFILILLCLTIILSIINIFFSKKVGVSRKKAIVIFVIGFLLLIFFGYSLIISQIGIVY
jgi:antitoxin component YwqK of YwqJK toxin-antitoxin module